MIAYFTNLALVSGRPRPVYSFDDATARDIATIWASISALQSRWPGEAPELLHPDFPMDCRQRMWTVFAQRHTDGTGNLPFVEELSRVPRGCDALDLGCGNSGPATTLLEMGWHVTALDCNAEVLKLLGRRLSESRMAGRLELLQADLVEYVQASPRKFHLVVANDIFSYLPPNAFQPVWMKIRDLVHDEGFFAGTFFFEGLHEPVECKNMLEEMGAWLLPDRRMVRRLLAEAGFEVISCVFRSTVAIEFLAKKIGSS